VKGAAPAGRQGFWGQASCKRQIMYSGLSYIPCIKEGTPFTQTGAVKAGCRALQPCAITKASTHAWHTHVQRSWSISNRPHECPTAHRLPHARQVAHARGEMDMRTVLQPPPLPHQALQPIG